MAALVPPLAATAQNVINFPNSPCGRKSRRERRAFREKKLLGRKLSPPSYAATRAAPIADLIRTVTKAQSRSRSRSDSPPNAGMIQYITSFGGDETPLEPPPPQIIKTR
ncbi:hypothetical protein J6590_046439 [Homalodisca vitripennis]|nr:hypothetical protein J6590_046439 [Homalodisca vitripennis]